MVALAKELREEYERLYKTASVKADKVETMRWYANKIQKNQGRYEAVSAITKVPWHVIAAIHHLESSADFGTHLHNGDPLSARTVHVPAGRPKTHAAPFTWEESAIDALGYDGATGIKNWDLATTLWFCEMYNGSGYRTGSGRATVPPMRSPYLWSYTDQYISGRYVADGKFDANAVSGQAGCVSIWKTLEARGLIKPLGTPQEPKPEPKVLTAADVTWFELHQTSKELVCVAYAGSQAYDSVHFTTIDDLCDFRLLFKNAHNLLLAPEGKSIPVWPA
jgi:lysozyme family protein